MAHTAEGGAHPRASPPADAAAVPAKEAPVREAAAAEVADSGAADQLNQGRPASRQEGGAPAAASPVDDEGTAARPGGETEEEQERPAGGRAAQEGSEEPSPQAEAVQEASNGVEAERSPEWQRQPKHVFVLTSAGAQRVARPSSDSACLRTSESPGWPIKEGQHSIPDCLAGKPIFTAHGKEDELAGFMALIQALVSVVRDTGDSLQTVRWVPHRSRRVDPVSPAYRCIVKLLAWS